MRIKAKVQIIITADVEASVGPPIGESDARAIQYEMQNIKIVKVRAPDSWDSPMTSNEMANSLFGAGLALLKAAVDVEEKNTVSVGEMIGDTFPILKDIQ